MKFKYVIYAPPYDENSGGPIVLHRLCHLINECGGEAYLHPYVPSFEVHHYNATEIGVYSKRIYAASQLANYRINTTFKTPVLPPKENFAFGNDCIILYPEITFGNPLRARNVVRWLLHKPGFHTGKIYYGAGEIYYRYAEFLARDFHFPGSELADLLLRIQYTPFELYAMPRDDSQPERTGRAYCLRKGHNRPDIPDMADAILIDGKSHAEVAAIFKSVKQFITYDLYTKYSYLAAIAGCDSIVAPLATMTKEQWRPNIDDRYGLAYGFDDIEFARSTRALAIERQRSLEHDSAQRVAEFMLDVEGRLSKRID